MSVNIISDSDILNYFDENLQKEGLIEKFQSVLLVALKKFQNNPAIVPPRLVQKSNTLGVDTTHLFMPCNAPNQLGLKVVSGGEMNNAKGLGFQGCILVLDEVTGRAKALLNAKTITAFRTALASSLPMVKVFPVSSDEKLGSLSVFGVGPQAMWHIRLTLTLFKGRIGRLNVINRTLDNARKFSDQVKVFFPEIDIFPFSYSNEDSKPEIKEAVSNSSIIFGCCPSTEPVILENYVNEDPSKKKFISLIGSYKSHMIELDTSFFKRYFKGKNKPKVLVDSSNLALSEAGELIQSGLEESDLMEIVDLYYGSVEEKEFFSSSGVAISKIVGLSIMDLAVASEISNDINKSSIIVVEDF